MELRHLRYFRAAVEAGSFHAASRQLHIAQTAVSQTIADLESELGVKLFERTRQGLSLTPAGVSFAEEAKAILRRAEDAVHSAVRASRGQTATLRIAFLGSAAALFLPSVIRQFAADYPEVSVMLHELGPRQQRQQFESGELDLGIGFVPYPRLAGLRQELLFEDPLMAVLREDHPCAEMPALQISDLRTEPFVLYSAESAPALFDSVSRLFAAGDYSPRIVAQPDLMQTVLTLVEAGAGISIVPGCVRNLQRSGCLRFVTVEPDVERIPVCVLWPERLDRDAGLRHLLALIRSANLVALAALPGEARTRSASAF